MERYTLSIINKHIDINSLPFLVMVLKAFFADCRCPFRTFLVFFGILRIKHRLYADNSKEQNLALYLPAYKALINFQYLRAERLRKLLCFVEKSL